MLVFVDHAQHAVLGGIDKHDYPDGNRYEVVYQVAHPRYLAQCQGVDGQQGGVDGGYDGSPVGAQVLSVRIACVDKVLVAYGRYGGDTYGASGRGTHTSRGRRGLHLLWRSEPQSHSYSFFILLLKNGVQIVTARLALWAINVVVVNVKNAVLLFVS